MDVFDFHTRHLSAAPAMPEFFYTFILSAINLNGMDFAEYPADGRS
jgi:hypothetical protein